MRGALLLALLAGCPGATPTDTGTTCPQPDPGTLTYDNFGKPFMDTYCRWCHDSSLPRSRRNGAPLYHDFDDLQGILQVRGHIDQQTGIGPNAANHFMPPDRCPTTLGGPIDTSCAQPTDEERRQLAEWLACEQDRPHPF